MCNMIFNEGVFYKTTRLTLLIGQLFSPVHFTVQSSFKLVFVHTEGFFPTYTDLLFSAAASD